MIDNNPDKHEKWQTDTLNVTNDFKKQNKYNEIKLSKVQFDLLTNLVVLYHVVHNKPLSLD